MERVKIADGSTWPDPSGADFKDLVWALRHGHELLKKGHFFAAAEVMEAYSNLILHPDFSLEMVKQKVKGIRNVMKKG